MPAARPLFIHALTLRPVAGVNDVRVLLPCKALAREPGVRIAIEQSGADLRLGRADEDKVFIWQRPILRRDSAPPAIRRLIAAGYVVITEFDDHPMVWPDIEASGYLNYTGVHAVQCSTENLRRLFLQWNPNVTVFPNAVETLPPLREERPGPLRLLFAALRREDDWAPLLPTLNAVLAGNPGLQVTVVYDRKLFDALETQSKILHPMLPYQKYLEVLGTAHINLLPLLDDEFRRMKSDVKFVESAAHGAVALASPTAYADSLRHGETGMIFRDPGEFGTHLRELIARPELRNKLRRAAWEYVARERMLSQQVATRLAWYRGLCARREELTAQLYARVPSLVSP
jgi:hypothetical protein